MTAVLRTRDGMALSFDVDRYCARHSAADESVLCRALPPVMDIGCGPGRLVSALAERGFPALGIDASPAVVALARLDEPAVLHRSVFDELPRQGHWGSALLIDGNIGIGGDPVTLLRRTGEIVIGTGNVLVEVERPGSSTRRLQARVECDDQVSAWFDWACVSADGLSVIAEDAGWLVHDVWEVQGRWFAELQH